jgi:Ala-tRNA(Pro) deacylase
MTTTPTNDRTPVDIFGVLAQQGITYRRYDHEAVFTCEEADRAVPPTGAAHTKNLFLRDKKGQRHWLLVTLCEKAIDLRQVAEVSGADKLSFGSSDRLQRYLGVTPGAVTVLALVHDPGHQVIVLIDEDVWNAAAVQAHPLVNTATLVITQGDLRRFLAATGHTPQIVTLEHRPREPQGARPGGEGSAPGH